MFHGDDDLVCALCLCCLFVVVLLYYVIRSWFIGAACWWCLCCWCCYLSLWTYIFVWWMIDDDNDYAAPATMTIPLMVVVDVDVDVDASLLVVVMFIIRSVDSFPMLLLLLRCYYWLTAATYCYDFVMDWLIDDRLIDDDGDDDIKHRLLLPIRCYCLVQWINIWWIWMKRLFCFLDDMNDSGSCDDLCSC